LDAPQALLLLLLLVLLVLLGPEPEQQHGAV
jgi:hypothetical protein